MDFSESRGTWRERQEQVSSKGEMATASGSNPAFTFLAVNLRHLGDF